VCVFVVAAAAASCGNSSPTRSSGATTTASSSTSSSSSGGDAGSVAACASCLDGRCSAEKMACDAECYGIQACIDAVCFNLSATGSPDEGACQAYCQGLHPAGKANHLAYVDCAANETPGPDAGTTCLPPCAGAPYDYEQCAAGATAGSCKPDADACTASSDCQAYKTCASACTTFNDCQTCAMGASGGAGEQLFETLQLCIAHACLAEEWVPHF
jgi:hypothetical protein